MKTAFEKKFLSLIQVLKIKLSEELQDYKVKSIFQTERLQDSVWREELQDYRITREEGLQKSF